MPTPTSSTETRSDRFSRLVNQATEEFPHLGFKPDEANGTTEEQISYTCQINGRGTVRVVMAISEAGIHMAGTLTLPNGQLIPLCRELSKEAVMDCSLFDLHSDRRNLATFKGLIRKFIIDAQPRNSKRRRLELAAA